MLDFSKISAKFLIENKIFLALIFNKNNTKFQTRPDQPQVTLDHGRASDHQ
jgi:hypothetical protein